MKNQILQDFQKSGLGSLYFDLYSKKIDTKEFVDKLEIIENRPIMRFGRFINYVLATACPIFFSREYH